MSDSLKGMEHKSSTLNRRQILKDKYKFLIRERRLTDRMYRLLLSYSYYKVKGSLHSHLLMRSADYLHKSSTVEDRGLQAIDN